MAPVVDGSDAVINTVGHYVERGKATFEAIHGQGALHVARASAMAGVRRLAHTGPGRRSDLRLPYVRARGIGEDRVEKLPGRHYPPPERYLRPGGRILNRLAALARVMPVLPLFGSGETKLQPVYVGDVAEAVARALATAAAEGKVYELGGPRVYTYKALVQLVLTQIGRKRLLLPFPYFAWKHWRPRRILPCPAIRSGLSRKG